MRDVSTASFSGPLDLLLRLIEDQQMDISQVSLGTVTEQYLAALQKLEELPVDELADFLVVAAKLVYIKSKLMLPTAAIDDEDVGTDLERQLRLYKTFVEAAKDVHRLWNRRRPIYTRDGYAHLEPIFNPPADLQAEDLRAIFGEILKELEPITRLPQTVLIRTINIRQTIARIRDQLVTQRRAHFHTMLRQAKNRTEAIVTFLAMLELVKQRTVTIVQVGRYGDMEIVLLEDAPVAEGVITP
jgi:segregation and condensation protein A